MTGWVSPRTTRSEAGDGPSNTSKCTSRPTHNGTYGRMITASETAHNAGYGRRRKAARLDEDRYLTDVAWRFYTWSTTAQ